MRKKTRAMMERQSGGKVDEVRMFCEIYKILVVAFHREGLLCPEPADQPNDGVTSNGQPETQQGNHDLPAKPTA